MMLEFGDFLTSWTSTWATTTLGFFLLFVVPPSVYVALSILVFPYASANQDYLASTPWVGLRRQWFARFRAGRRFVKDARAMFEDGYVKYSKKNLPFVIPQFNSPAPVALPYENIAEFVNFPVHQVSSHQVMREQIAADYTLRLDPQDEVHKDVVRHQLTRKLPLLTTSVYEELCLATEDQLDIKPDCWTTVPAFSTCMAIVSRAANRVFGGKELCRSPLFLQASRGYTLAVFQAGASIRLIPPIFRPLLAPIINRRAKLDHFFNLSKQAALPVIHQRIEALQSPDQSDKSDPPVDALQWLVEECVKLARTDASQLDDNQMVGRLLHMNMVAIHTTAITTTNMIFDLYSSPRRDEFVAGIRAEVEQVLRENDGVFTKHAVNSMHRIDSALRESMRVTPLAEGQLRREVITGDGVTLAGGIHLPYRTRTIVAARALHHDPDIYGDDAGLYDAFRFSHPREEYLQQIAEGRHPSKHLKTVLQQKNQALVATGDDFLAFGHGKHACPGRFFASQEMKLMIAHIVTHFDIEIVGDRRPPNLLMNGNSIPDPKVKIRLKPVPSNLRII